MRLSFVFTAAACLMIAVNVLAVCPGGVQSLGKIGGKEACALRGTYKGMDMLITSDKLWVLQGGVFIGGDNKDNVRLTIQAGTKIIGQSGADFLVITRGSQIFAEGTPQAPIVFTAAGESERTRGMWGGLIINGNAPINKCSVPGDICQAEGEGSTGLYGGNNPNDNSGVLKYVRVEFAGFEITPDNELNGISFQGVGSGTKVDYIQVHMNADDGIEFFGGTVNVKHIVLTGNKDDSLDWTSGWIGKAQFILVKQFGQGNNGIEADNLSSSMNARPRSNPTLSNMTFVGTMESSAQGGSAVLLRNGTGATILNSIFTGFKQGCVDIDDDATFDFAKSGRGVLFEHNLFHCDVNFVTEKEDSFSVENFLSSMSGNRTLDPMLGPDFVPAPTSPALVGRDITPVNLWFSEVDYIGAVRDANDLWYKGWTIAKHQ